jgi:hypothetical protein
MAHGRHMGGRKSRMGVGGELTGDGSHMQVFVMRPCMGNNISHGALNL